MTATVTPIRSGDANPPGPGDKPPRKGPRQKKAALVRLLKYGEGDRVGTQLLIYGLRGVCQALDNVVGTDGCNGGVEHAADLCMAAMSLSEIIASRVAE